MLLQFMLFNLMNDFYTVQTQYSFAIITISKMHTVSANERSLAKLVVMITVLI